MPRLRARFVILSGALAALGIAQPQNLMAQTASDAPIATGPRPGAPVKRTLKTDAPPAPGQVLKAIDANEVAALLQQAGLEPTWKRNADGGRTLFGSVEGRIPFQVVLQQCVETERGCVDFELYSGFLQPRRPSLEQLNRWNREQTWAAFAYLTTEGGTALHAQYTLSGGVTPEHLTELLSAWAGALQRFATEFGLGETKEAAASAPAAKP